MDRQEYLTSENITSESWVLSDRYQKRRTKFLLENDTSSETTALLVLDMQNYFNISESHACISSAKCIVPNLISMIELFRDVSMPVIFTKHINTPENAGMMDKWWSELLNSVSFESQIIPVLVPYVDTLIEKTQYDAFFETELADILKKAGVRRLVITGVMTHLCCETTARSAFVRGFEVFFPVDGTATYNKVFHEASLQNLSHGFAHILTCADIEKIL